MATTENLHIGDGTDTKFSFTFPYLNQTDVEVYKYVTNAWVKQTVTTHYTFDNATTIKFGSAPAAATSAEQTKLGNNKNIKIKRNTSTDKLAATFYPGSAIRSVDLNDNYTQNLYVTQEAENDAAANTKAVDRIVATTNDDGTTWVLAGNNTNASTDPKGVGYAVTQAETADTNATAALNTSRESDGSGGFTSAINVANAAKTQSTAAENTANNASAAVSGKLDKTGGQMTGNITMSGSQTVDGRDLSADGDKLDDIEPNADVTDAVNVTAAGALMDSEVTNLAFVKGLTKGIGDGNVLTANNAVADDDFLRINGTEVEGRSASEVRSDLNVADGANNYSISSDLLDEDNFSSDNQYKVPSQQSTKAYIAATSQPLAPRLTTLAGMEAGTASILTGSGVSAGTALTANLDELNLLDNKSIVTTISGSPTDTQIPTAQAVDERIIDLVDEVGGFKPIANETSFPTDNPDIDNNAGTIVSIKALASDLTSNGSGVATITNGAGSGKNVTITGMANNDTIEAGKGILVETTTTSGNGSATPPREYTFHRETLAPSDVADAKTLVTDFNQRYQVAGSAPSTQPDGTALVEGDLFFDTSTDDMKVYDGSAYKVVTSAGDYKLLTVKDHDQAHNGSGPTFNGSNEEFDLFDGSSDASIQDVGQLLVSLNGVIQKPNEGTFDGSAEGFYLNDTHGIKFCDPPPSGSSLFVTQIGTATTINVPADGSVTTAKIANDAVDGAKLANNIDIAGTLDVTSTATFDNTITAANTIIANRTGNSQICFQATKSGVTKATIDSDGAATFNGDVLAQNAAMTAGGNPTSGANSGCKMNSGGYIYIATDDGNPLLRGYSRSGGSATQNVTILSSGKAVFANIVQSGCTGDGPMSGGETGSALWGGSGLVASAASGSFVYRGFTTGTSTETSSITGAGAATFAGYTTVGPYTSAGTTSQCGVQLRDNGEVLMNKNSGDAITVYNAGDGTSTKTFVLGADGDIHIKASDGNTKIQMLNDGAATFSGVVHSDNYFEADRTDGSYGVFYGQLNGTNTSAILASGKATFDNVVVADRSTSGDGCFHAALNGDVKASITSAGAATFSGNVGVGVDSSATVTHHVKNTGTDWSQRLESTHASNPYGVYINYPNEDPNSGSGNEFISCYATPDGGSNTAKFKVWSNGDTDNATNTFGSLSDVKLKQDIVDAASQWDDIKAVKVRNFKFKTDTTKTLLGVVAQEIETVSPGLVKDTPDRDADGNLNGETTKTVKYSILYMKAIKALQEAMTKIETLETKVAALEAK